MPLTREQTNYVPTNDTVFLPTVAIDRNLGVRGNSVFDGTATFNNGLIVNQSGSIFGGTINENSVIPGLHAGIQNGTPRLMFAPPGSLSSANNWQIDVNVGVFRWFTPGVVQMSLTPSPGIGSTLAVYQANVTNLIGSGNVGIGVTSPASKLHVKNSSNGVENYQTGTWAAQIYNANDAAGSNGLLVGNRWLADTSTVFEVGSIYGTGSAWSTYYKISGGGTHTFASGSSGTTRMTIDTAGTVTVAGNLVQNVNVTPKTAAYQLTAADANTILIMNGAFAFNIDTTLAVLPLGTTITLVAQTAGVTIAANGAVIVPTLSVTPGLKLRAAWSTASLIKLSAATASGTASQWLVTGDLTA